MQTADTLRVSEKRLWDSLMAMAMIGPGLAGGNRRLALTDADRKARELFIGWCEAAGAAVTIDTVGNVFARRPGTDDSLPPVVIGSHLDTQPTGGRFDGVLGVLGGLEILRTLNDLGLRTRHPIEVVDWTNEEGARFAPAMIGSGVFAGVYGEDLAHAARDAEGRTFGDELRRTGFAGKTPSGGRTFRAYFELHIEQGPILESEGMSVGVVTGAQGVRWYDVTFTGLAAHAGTTPMARRRDALLGAARLVEGVHQIALSAAPTGVGTVGILTASPGSRNVIPDAALVTVDLRHPDAATLATMGTRLRMAATEIGGELGLGVEVREVLDYPPVVFDAGCVGAVRDAARGLGYRHRDLVSGAGHDACNIARVAPAAMVFCPCVGGISHNEAEDIRPDWAKVGAEVLLHAVAGTAEIAG